MTRPATHRRKRILITLGVLVATASYNPAHGQDLGQLYQSATNPYATDAPKLYDEEGNYRGKLSANPYDPESVSNPYGRYGSEHSADSINNPYGAGNEYRSDSPRNPYGVGMKIVADGQEEGDDDVASSAASPTFLPQPLPALKALTVETDPSD